MPRLGFLFAVSVALLAAGCGIGGEGAVDRPRFFRFLHTSDSTTFVARTTDEAVIDDVEQQLALPLEERSKHIAGPIAPGNGGHNGDYPWHFVAGEWALTEAATETCDARPSRVSENISYFVEEVGRYCPRNARVLEKVSEPDDGARPQ
jgi:hypothetical protein